VQRAFGADLALRFYQMVAVEGPMPGGGKNRVEIAVASIPALLAMKGFAVHGRHKQKDAYDIYYCVRNFAGGIEALAEACRPLLAEASAKQGYGYIAEKFNEVDGYGPTSVRRFVQDTQILGERTPEQWQQDAFGQVDAWLRALGLRD
jgi:predicted nucleotidyltransferase